MGNQITVTRIGGPTVLIEMAGWRILADPTFDEPGRRYSFGAGTSSVKTAGPAVPVAEIGRIDVALVSHDQHADNLDDAGRALLAQCEHVLTTAKGARRIGGAHVQGLAAGQTVRLTGAGRPDVEVTGTPARHGAWLTQPIVGPVTGFLVVAEGRSVWVSGDTVGHRALVDFARDLAPDVAIVNAGGVRFSQTGPLHYTMTGQKAVELIEIVKPKAVVPAHYEGWSHFRDGEDGFRRAVAAASPGVRETVHFLDAGVPAEF
jgi:L-ascorbate metabolism protein UlaG (beta-lactamase superfamily)